MENNSEVLFSTAYLPPILYFAHLVTFPAIKIEMEENFQKQTFRNRMEILGPNGKQTLSIPIVKAIELKQKTKDVRISYEVDWQKNHWKSIETAYNSSPFFLYYQDYFEKFYSEKKYEFLTDYNEQLLLLCLKSLKLKIEILKTSTYQKTIEGLDLREVISPKNEFVVKQKEDLFPPYIQVFSDKLGFCHNLSILDLLFNLGPEATEYLNSISENILKFKLLK